MSFIQRFMNFMQGRYGFDTLNGFLIILSVALSIANIFVWGLLPSLIIYGIELALMGIVVFRSLSRNIVMRSRENRVFRKAYDPVKNWIAFRIKKFKERKEFKYLKCPHCKAQLRVKNQKGEHGVRCPKCRGEFKVKI